MQIFPDSIDEFRSLLCRGVSQFLGNDSGPSHLAANLGIPTKYSSVQRTLRYGLQPDQE